MPTHLRTIEKSDDGFLFEVYASTRADEMALVDWSPEKKEAFLRMQFEAQHSYYLENYTGAQFLVILFDEQPAGRLYIRRKSDGIHIIDISLLPEFRNRGIGSYLFGEVLKEAQGKLIPVTIHVERFNPAQHLYQRLGFQLKEDKGVYLLLEYSPTTTESNLYAG